MRARRPRGFASIRSIRLVAWLNLPLLLRHLLWISMLRNGDLELSFATLEIRFRELPSECDSSFRLSAAHAKHAADRRPMQPRPFATLGECQRSAADSAFATPSSPTNARSMFFRMKRPGVPQYSLPSSSRSATLG